MIGNMFAINLFIFSFFFGNNTSIEQDAILGIWLTQDKEAKVEIIKKDNKYFGKIVWLKNPTNSKGQAMTDVNNPENSLKTRKLMGLSIINNLEYKEKEWINGTIYDPLDGSRYSCKLWIENKSYLKVRGYVGFVYDTETWTKVKP